MSEAALNTNDYHDQFPKSEGPPPVSHYDGPKILDATSPVIPVHLDAGAFRAVWELLEATTKAKYGAQSMSSTKAYIRAVTALRNAWWEANVPEEVPRRKLTAVKSGPKRKLSR